jgi:hypothetical protein
MRPSTAKAVALLALITAISSVQCLNFCAVHPCNQARSASAPVNGAQSCHYSPASSKSQPNEQRENCAHQPLLVSEKAPAVEMGAMMVSSGSLTIRFSPQQYAHSAILTADTIGSPPTEHSTTSVILRI